MLTGVGERVHLAADQFHHEAPDSVKARVVSGMRPTGQLHLGHLVGALQQLGAAAGRSTTASISSPTGTR